MESERVCVIDATGRPLLPTHPARARQLLTQGKATLVQRVPFAIRLNRMIEGPVRQLCIGIDDGATAVGLAVVDSALHEVVLAGEIRLRQDVPRKMEQRKNYRRARRSRNTRHRQPRFRRSKPQGWLAPTIRQKKDSVVRVVADLCRLLPIAEAVIEQGQFDTAALVAGHPLVGVEYQIPRYSGRDFRAKVLWRDGYQCQHCGSQAHLQAHHIQPRAEGGSDTPDNGITLCATCHADLHDGRWQLDIQPRQFHYPAHLQVGKHYLVAHIAGLGLAVRTCVGWMTSYWRNELGIAKSHANDAAAMVCRSVTPRLSQKCYRIIPKRKKRWEANPTKTCDEKFGFRHWDVVQAQHRTRGKVIGSIRSLKANVMTLRTSWDDNLPVSYRKARLLWRFNNIIYI
jgi:5-methylcytosine-specific restriction endonuclease McrA